MADVDDGRGGIGQLTQRVRGLLKPYADEPPPGLYRSTRPDLLIRMAGMAVPHFVSVVTRLGGDEELPEIAGWLRRTQTSYSSLSRPLRARSCPNGTRAPTSTSFSPPDARGSTHCAEIRCRSGSIRSRCGGSPTAAAGLSKCMA